MLKKIFIAILPLSSIAIIIWLVVPEYHALQSAKEAKGDAESTLISKQELVAKIRNLETQYRNIENLAGKVAQMVPSTPDVPNILAEIPDVCVQSGIIFKNMSIGNSSDSKTETAAFKPMQVTVEVSGTFDQFQSFLKNIEKELRIADVRSIDFNLLREANIKSIDFKVTLQLYYGLQA